MTVWDTLVQNQRAHTDGFATSPFWLVWRGFTHHQGHERDGLEPSLTDEDWSAQPFDS